MRYYKNLKKYAIEFSCMWIPNGRAYWRWLVLDSKKSRCNNFSAWDRITDFRNDSCGPIGIEQRKAYYDRKIFTHRAYFTSSFCDQKKYYYRRNGCRYV